MEKEVYKFMKKDFLTDKTSVLTIKDLSKINISLKNLYDICRSFNTFLLFEVNEIPESVNMYFKLKNIKIDYSYGLDSILINNNYIIVCTRVGILNEDDLEYIYNNEEIFNYISNQLDDLWIYGSEIDVDLLIKELNSMFQIYYEIFKIL